MQVQCPHCLMIGVPQDPGATRWDCRCGLSYELRRCSSCGVVSNVPSSQRPGEPWSCVWCKAPNHGYTSQNDPATSTLSDLSTDMARRGLTFSPSRAAQPADDTQPMLIVTTNEIPGYRISQVHGDVFGLTVRARTYFSNVGAQLRTLVGGEVTEYTRLLIDSRNQARERMWREARARGANAVVGMRFDCNEIGDIMSEIVAYGTAVTIELAVADETNVPDPAPGFVQRLAGLRPPGRPAKAPRTAPPAPAPGPPAPSGPGWPGRAG
jgi:uncharacterized protein YbjQ (UPF0145 family)